MAADFIGSTVLVTLKSPPSSQVRGIVNDIQDQVLYLRDVFWLASGHRTAKFHVLSGNLLDLEILPEESTHHLQPPSPLLSAPSPKPAPQEPSKPDAAPFVDPAILSIGKPPQLVKRSETVASATLTEPFDNLTLQSVDINQAETSELDTTEISATVANIQTSKKTIHEPKSTINGGGGAQTAFEELISRQLKQTNTSGGTSPIIIKQGQGARPRGRKQGQSATVQVDSLGIAEAAPKQKAKKGQVPSKHRARPSEVQSGWATEDATDIQELGDFDFAANLSKFDKREIFRQLKEDDTVAESARLVGHNRISRAGTAGGRNLHWTENVLDTPKIENSGVWNSEAGDSVDEVNDGLLNSGRSSRREKSQSRTRLPPSRKGSKQVDEPMKQRTMSQITVRQASFEATGSPNPRPKKTSSTSPYIGNPTSRPSLRIQGTNKICPSLTPIQMLEFEQFAITELGLSEDILTENAARGIAELATRVEKEFDETLEQDWLIVLVVGNHKTGARTLAAGRHLRNHGYNVMATVIGAGRTDEWLDVVRQQFNAYSKAGGILLKPHELLESMKSGLRPSLLIDGLLGVHNTLEDFRRDEQQLCFELMILTNRKDIKVLSVDVPSGTDTSNGQIDLADENPLGFVPWSIVSLGAPKSYLLSMLERDGPADNTKTYVADIGIGSKAWRKFFNRRRRGVDFGSSWIVQLRYQSGVE